jgi:hypothetical protein
MMQQYWFTFSSHIHGFLGVVVVEAEHPVRAMEKAAEIAPEATEQACAVACALLIDPLEEKWLNRLIVKPEIDEIGEPCTQAELNNPTVH